MMTSQVQQIIEWDIVNWSNALHFWEQELSPTNKKLSCLELGGRKGGPSLWLALKGHEVICSDLTNPEEEAKLLHDRHSFSGSISYEAIDATHIPYEEKFDIIIFKSILGGISRGGNAHINKQVLDQIHKALKPGGQLLFAENLEASFLHKIARKYFVKWGGEWNYFKYKNIDSDFSSFNTIKHDTVGFLGAFGRSEKQRQLLGKIDKKLKRITPKSKRYILFGAATK